MMDVVVTVPKDRWGEWLAEGDLAGQRGPGEEYGFYIGGRRPAIQAGERVYIVAHGRLRGHAPLVHQDWWDMASGALIRKGGAVAVTIPGPVRGFRGWRYRWWPREDEIPFPDWQVVV